MYIFFDSVSAISASLESLFSSLLFLGFVLSNTGLNRIHPPVLQLLSLRILNPLPSPLLFRLDFFFFFLSHFSLLTLLSSLIIITTDLRALFYVLKGFALLTNTVVVILPIQTHSFSNACDKEVRTLRDWRPMFHVSYVLNNRILMFFFFFSQKKSQQQ